MSYCSELCELIEKEIDESYSDDYRQGLYKAKEIIENYFKSK